MTQERGVSIDIKGVQKAFNGHSVLNGVDLHIDAGEIMVIVGGSGEGKSVLLRHIAGLETPDAGTIRLNNTDIGDYLKMDPDEKPFRLSMVFQSSALLNSISVAENVALPLALLGVSAAERASRAAEALQSVGLGAFAAPASNRWNWRARKTKCRVSSAVACASVWLSRAPSPSSRR